MSTELSALVAEDVSAIEVAPGFPNIRLSPALFNGEIAQKIPAAEEQLLFAMHCTGGKFLVITNKNLFLYKLPRFEVEKKRGIMWAIGWLLTILSFVPVFGELFEAFEKILGMLEWLWERVSGKLRKEREEARKEILSYNEAYLANNYSLTKLRRWKTKFAVSLALENGGSQPITISVEGGGIRIAAGRKKAFAAYLKQDFGPLKIAKEIIDRNCAAIEEAGWSVQSTTMGYTFKTSNHRAAAG